MLRLQQVEYNRDTQRQRLLEIIRELLVERESQRGKYDDLDEESFDRKFILAMLEALGDELVFLKAPEFAEEHEWRAAVFGTSVTELKFRARQGVMIPYYEYSILWEKRVPSREVYVSPLGDQELATRTADLLLRRQGWTNPSEVLKTPGYRLRF